MRKEVEIALHQEIHGRRVKVLPLLHKPCELPLFLVGKLYADFSRDFQTGFAKLIARLNSDLVDSSHQVARAHESFLSDYQRWVAFNRHTQYLLGETTLAMVPDAVPASSISVDLLEFVLSSMSQIACGSTPIKLQWIRWLDEVPDSIMIAVFEVVFERGGPNVRGIGKDLSTAPCRRHGDDRIEAVPRKRRGDEETAGAELSFQAPTIAQASGYFRAR